MAVPCVISRLALPVVSMPEPILTEAQAKKFIVENEVLKIFLPVEMSYGEIEDALTECLFSNVGEAIKCLDAKYAGKYDKAVACKIAKDLL